MPEHRLICPISKNSSPDAYDEHAFLTKLRVGDVNARTKS